MTRITTSIDVITDLHDEIERLERELAQMSGWLPISEAPKDGTELLLISAKGRIANGCWLSANDKTGGWMWPYINQEPVAYRPMLPPPPSTKVEPHA